MPLASARLRMQRGATNADAVYWEWAVDGATYDDIDGLALVNATLAGVETAVGVGGSSNLVDMDADLIELFPGGGGPAYYVQGLAEELPVGTSSAGNHIVQCAVNELVATPRGNSPRGRMFVGPLAATGATTLSSSQRDFAVSVMQEVAAAHISAGFTPVVISRYEGGTQRPSPVGLPVIGFRADLRLDVLVSRRIPAPVTNVDFPLVPEA